MLGTRLNNSTLTDQPGYTEKMMQYGFLPKHYKGGNETVPSPLLSPVTICGYKYSQFVLLPSASMKSQKDICIKQP